MADHILKESVSPIESMVWTMHCGAQCIAFDDGSLIPEDMDFYLERDAHKATCPGCIVNNNPRINHGETLSSV